MKSSAWSSRSIWVSSAVASTALALAPAAAAHVGLSPARVAPGSEAQLVFAVPDEESVPITRVAIGLPPDFKAGAAEAKPGWTVHPGARTVMWDGNAIKPGRYVRFGLYVEAPTTEERAVFSVLVSLGNGKTLTYHPALDVQPAASIHDRGARTLATAALIVATLATVLGLAAGFLGLWLWLRPRPPDTA